LADNDGEETAVIDPVYGAELENFPGDRGRLLLKGGVVYFGMTFVVNAAFTALDASVVIGVMAALALLVGWYILHLWNREVVLYERGFSYREGSRIVYFLYTEVRSFHQRAERIAYFGGLIRRTLHRITLKTTQGETIILDRTYRKIERLGMLLEQFIHRAQRPVIEAKLQNGSEVPFGGVSLSRQGIRLEGQLLDWENYAGHTIGEGRLTLKAVSTPNWGSVPLADIHHPTLLLEFLQRGKSL
jgi:uncharacterized membrane protein YobD (UPF0266 family)